MTETKMVQSYYCHYSNRYFDNLCVSCVFFWQKHEENSIFYFFCTHPCKRISISPDVTIIARCDKCANTGCIVHDCLCVYAYARMALAIMPTSHAEVIIRSHCLDNNNCAPSFLRSLREIGGDCFGPRYFSEGAQLPKKNTEVQNNHRRIHTMTETKIVQSYYCH